MRLHETWTGAANPGDKTFGVGSVEGSVFTAYASGCNIVILSSSFERAQIIPGVCHDNIQISCLDCSSDTGKIAAAYDDQVIIFEPTPLISPQSKNSSNSNDGGEGYDGKESKKLNYWWVETARIKAECNVSTLAWNNDATRFFTAGEFLQLWQHEIKQGVSTEEVTFELGQPSSPSNESKTSWSCLWKTRPANPITFMSVSADGSLFATAGANDRLVRIWYQNQQLMFPNQSMTQDSIRQAVCSDITFSFIYLAHPRSVTGISWRKTSRYMPRGAVSNVLVTSCLDNICRIWSETILPEDGVVSMSQLDPNAAQDTKFRTHRQKARFVQRFRHMRQSFAARRVVKGSSNGFKPSNNPDPVASLPSTYSVHEFHNYGFQGTGISPGLHFHLSGTINATTDIPLVPSISGQGNLGHRSNSDPTNAGGAGGDSSRKNKHNFVLHWMNNKEMEFTVQAEKIMEDMLKMALERDDMSEEALEYELTHPDRTPNIGGGTNTTTLDHDSNADTISLKTTRKSHINIETVSQTGSSSSLALSEASNLQSVSTNVQTAGVPGTANISLNLSDTLDHRIETILKAWHQNSDLLFSIHPIDGSLLVWIADFLDEYQPGSFRQTQISFSSRIPNAFPIGDAMTMGSSVCIYNTMNKNFREMFKNYEKKLVSRNDDDDDEPDEAIEAEEDQDANGNAEEPPPIPAPSVRESPKKSKKPSSKYKPTPIVGMISKHTNGTLNLWNVMFTDKSKFTNLLNIRHKSRASGHRFRVNDIACHPVLPLLLTTSHHNVLHNNPNEDTTSAENDNFCSELILWRVDPVGPLSKSGGITELARINSQEISAFSNVAWLPTLLPSSTLGSISNSPSACFAASDGKSLRVYQAVIDARTLISELNQGINPKQNLMDSSLMSMSSEEGSSTGKLGNLAHAAKLQEKFKIVSSQSSARPGAIIELEPIEDAIQDWQNTMLLHTFQEQVILSQGSSDAKGSEGFGLITANMSAMVDLQNTDGGHFKEPFYILVMEKLHPSDGGNGGAVMMHMWRLVLASEPDDKGQATYDSSGSVTPDAENPQDHQHHQMSEVHVSTEKVCTSLLPLPEGVEVVHAVPAVGHLSSSSIYPACLAPYVIVTACSDNKVRFWRTRMNNNNNEKNLFEWEEWKMESAEGISSIEVPGRPVSVSAAFTGRVAIAYQSGTSFQRKTNQDQRYVNLCTAIYECESTGGSEWIKEDVIHLKNIEMHAELPPMDLSVFNNGTTSQNSKAQEHMHKFAQQLQNDHEESDRKQHLKGLMSVPSLSTLEGVKKYINAVGNTPSAIAPKQTVMLDWASKEDGSHILTITVGNKVLFLTAVSTDITEANVKAMSEKTTLSGNRTLIRQSSSMAFSQAQDEIRWMQIRRIVLKTVDGLSPLPMSSAWVRDGLFVIGMDSEFAVYSQWRDDSVSHDDSDIMDHRNLADSDLMTIAQESSMRSIRGADGQAAAKSSLADIEKRKKGVVEDIHHEAEIMSDFGLFEASHIACPVLPQYHPKQLMELLNSGKIRWVKAILAHLVRCIGGSDRHRPRSGGSFNDDGNKSPRNWSRSRTLSVSYGAPGGPMANSSSGALSPGGHGEGQRSSVSAMPEELTLDYTEINSIPPLPLWTLLAADQESSKPSDPDTGFDDLFSNANQDGQDNIDSYLEDVDDDLPRPMTPKKDSQGLSYFGPRQSRILSKLLTHASLPGLSSLDQMHLLAMADTVASCKIDLAERFAIDAARNAMDKENATGTSTGGEPSLESLDDCGLRFLLAMKQFMHLQKCLPMAQRKSLQKQGLNSSHLIWGFHSESEDELLNMIPSVVKGTPTWADLRELGMAWWIRNNNILRKLIEKVAKASFQKTQDPLDAAIFYLAMKKKSLVWGLYRSIKDEKMTAFFKNNFSEDRWRKAALKNAFALLGKQRFTHAAAFFLLSGSLKDALDICMDKLGDLQLAMVLARLYDGEINPIPDSYKNLLYKHVLGSENGKEIFDTERAHPDPFLRSMALWTIKDYSGSLKTLVTPNVGQLHPKYDDNDVLKKKKSSDAAVADPSVFNFYVYLRTHPLIQRHNLTSKKAELKKQASSIDQDLNVEDTVTPLERKLYFSTAHFHLRAGCPALAVEVLTKLPNKVIESKNETTKEGQDNLDADAHEDHNKLQTGVFGQSDKTDWSFGTGSKTSQTNQDYDWSTPSSGDKKPEDDDSLGLDWGQPIAKQSVEDPDDELKLEWSDDPDDSDDEDQIKKAKSKLNDPNASKKKKSGSVGDNLGAEDDDDYSKPAQYGLDIMAQQFKFIACLKIMMEELSTLATGFEVDGGLLRYQLYIWLEREVEALKQLTNYGVSAFNKSSPGASTTDTLQSMRELFAQKGRMPTLHEVMMAEKADFEAKVERATKRKAWLTANQTLLRTLLSYCSLRGGANGCGGLASVRMELILLLQELQQEKSHKQLLSPLPFPTTLPLLSACIAQQKTVVADPVRHLHNLAHDMLISITDQSSIPLPGMIGSYSTVFLLRDMAVALSSCIYQSLSDSDAINSKKFTAKDYATGAVLEAVSRLSVVYQDSSLITSTNTRKMSYDGSIVEVTTEPPKWPGVTSLRALLDRDKDEETPNLIVLLCEAFVAIYMSLLSYALATCDAHILYRLIGQKIDPATWAGIFGGGCKKVLQVATAPNKALPKQPSPLGDLPDQAAALPDSESILNTMTSITKQRVKLNIKVLGVQLGEKGATTGGSAAHPNNQTGTGNVNSDGEKQTSREQFKAPEMSIVSKLMAKPLLDGKDLDIEVDSTADSDSEEYFDEDDEDDDPFANIPIKDENNQHSDPNSYAWCLMRYASIHLAQGILERFLSLAGVEPSELPLASPLVYASLKMTETWKESVMESLLSFNCAPDNFIPGCFADSNATGPAINKYRGMIEPQNTPFKPNGHGLGPIKRLWMFLVRQECIQNFFIKFIFGRKAKPVNFRGMNTDVLHESASFISDANTAIAATGDEDQLAVAVGLQLERMKQPVKIIHKEQDAVTAFCINKVSSGLMAISTQKELQELDVSLLLNPNTWQDGMNEEADFDVLNLNEDPDALPASNYLVIQTPGDPYYANAGSSQINSPTGQPPPFGPSGASASAKGGHGGSTVPGLLDDDGGILNPFNPKVKRHRVDGVRRLAAHSHLPLYITGCQDGSIKLWEWSHMQAVQTVRPSGVFAKVNRVRFTQQGNKFGACDGDGNVAFWQASNATAPFFNYHCHSKGTSDFVFQGGSSSLFCTVGHSGDGKNVALWDTLMPQRRSLVESYTFHESGASALLFAPQHNQLVTAGKKGHVAIWDIRQHRQLHCFKAHDHPIKCLAIDPNEEFFVTGSVDGDIKVWSLSNHKWIYTFNEEHTRHGIFKNISQGVLQVFVDSHNRLFSCGADGSIKVRQLPDRDFIVSAI